MEILKMTELMLLVIYGAINDIKEKKIPNEIFYIGLASALIFDTVLMPVSWQYIVLKAVCIVGLFFFGMLRLMGIGDIKLWMVLTAYWGITRSSAIICAASILLIVTKFITDKETRSLIFLSVHQIAGRQKLKIMEQKSYAFAPYIAVPTIIICIYEMVQ